MTRAERREFVEARGIVENLLDLEDEIENTKRLVDAFDKRIEKFDKIRIYNLERNWGELIKRVEAAEERTNEVELLVVEEKTNDLDKLMMVLLETKCELLDKQKGKEYRTNSEKHFITGKLEGLSLALDMIAKLRESYKERISMARTKEDIDYVD